MSQPARAPLILRWLNKAARKGWIRFDQYSPLKRLAIAYYILSRGLWRSMRQITDPGRALWALIFSSDRYTLSLPGHPVQTLQMSPLNFLSLLRLIRAGYVPKAVDAEKNALTIEMAPGVFYTAYVANAMDLVPLKELLLEQEYGASFRGYRILDVGAYRGETALFFCIHGAEKVIAAEPAPDNYALAQQNIQQSPYQERIDLLPLAIADKSGTLPLCIDPRHSNAHRLNLYHEDAQEASLTVEVPVWGFQQLVDYSGWDEIDMVKLDCEGAEYPILLNTPAEILRRVRRWMIEYHDSPAPLQRRLREMGYEVQSLRDRGTLGILYAERLSQA